MLINVLEEIITVMQTHKIPFFPNSAKQQFLNVLTNWSVVRYFPAVRAAVVSTCAKLTVKILAT